MSTRKTGRTEFEFVQLENKLSLKHQKYSAAIFFLLISLGVNGFLLLKNHSIDKQARFWRSWKNACVERYGEVPQNYLFNSKGEFRERLRYDEPL
jgi:hypothetical protein